MDFRQLYQLQEELDQYIETNHNLIEESLLERKLMALHVEVAELINETRCFKFWSEKGPSARDVILEEYVDGIHFLLSIGIELKFNHLFEYEYPETLFSSNLEQVALFFEVMDSIQQLRKDRTKENFIKLFQKYLIVGSSLNFEPQEILDAYLHKNQVNHSRQDQGY